MDARSENIRRSKRLQAKEAGRHAAASESAVKDTEVEERKLEATEDKEEERNRVKFTKTKSRKSISSIASRRRRAEIETAIEKKKLEQEMLDLQLALKLTEFEENDELSESDCKSESIHESIEPNMEEWMDGRLPWNHGHDPSSIPKERDRYSNASGKKDTKVEENKVREYNFDKNVIASTSRDENPITLPQITKILTRQSLPKELPIFDGNPLDWPNFIYQFRNTSRICGFSNEENQSRLQKCLRGNAKSIVQSLLILPQNVDKVINLLETRFGRAEYIISLLLDKIRRFPQIKEEKLDSFVDFSDEIKNFVATVQCLEENDHLRNPMLITEILNKLPISYKLLWVEHISKVKFDVKLIELSNWLDEKANAIAEIHIPKFDKQQKYKSNVNRDVTLTTSDRISNKRCFCCNREIHPLSSCAKFSDLSVGERWSLIREKKICFSCLTPFHNIRQCRKKKVCGIDDCKRLHHTLLHNQYEGKDNLVPQNSNATETNCRISNSISALMKILPVILRHNGKEVETYVLLDDASTITLIDEEFADSLDLTGPKQSLCLQWTNEDVTHHENDSRIVSFTIKGKNNGSYFQLRHVRTTKLSLPHQTIDVENLRKVYPYINDEVISMTNAQPKIIIGQDNWPLLVNRKLISGPWNGPAVSKTLLGWVIHGNLKYSEKTSNSVCHIQAFDILREKDDLDVLHDLVKEHWRLERIENPQELAPSPEDRRAQRILDTTMKRVGKRYETGLLWKSENLVLPESKTNALRRLRCVERKMDKDKEYAEMYSKKLKEMEEKKYIRRLSKNETEDESNKIWYLPHFGVINPNKPNKLRIVFDASAKSNGISLNDCLLTGPDLYNSLQTILLNFRIKKYAFTSDIKEMFLQVRVRKEDCYSQRILWRGMDRNVEPDIYEIMVVFFGSTCGPCLAQEAKNRNARDFSEAFPEASEAIIRHHYMDDYLGNADTLDEAEKLIRDVIHVHQQGGFVICNWIANDERILQGIDVDLVAQGHKKLDSNNHDKVERILGVYWNPVDDTFSFQTKFHKIDRDILENRRRPTKRDILKIVMSVFDPLGFIANFIVQGKVLLQNIWRSQIDWDDEITDILNDQWQIWLSDLKNIYKFQIPRQYFSLNRNRSEIQLHVFCDASETSYAAVAYIRIQEEQLIQTNFVTAKTRVAPLRPLSIPRLELQGALMGARLGNSLKKSMELEISSIFYWTDSKTVLHWIRSEARRFKVFIAQRLGEIQDITNIGEWKYVNSKENAADDATKRKICWNSQRWMNGPDFLRKFPEDWPKEVETERYNISPDILEEKCENILIISQKQVLPTPDDKRFSKWQRLLRTTSYVLKFIDIINKRCVKRGELSVEEINNAENLLFRKVQEESFMEEIIALKNNKPFSSNSRLRTLNCIISEGDGLLRLSGRLDKSTLNLETKKPIILDPHHRITRLIVQKYHEDVHHHGQEIVINNIRQKFWILRLRQTVKSIWNSCQLCKIRRATPKIPVMGQLPECRIQPTIRAFMKTGIDYFGPLEVTVKRSREKRYGAIFTCMTTRAVHLELAHDLTTNSFINVLRQFGCRRGFPDEIYCDNGSCFRSAEKEIKEEFQKMKKKTNY